MAFPRRLAPAFWTVVLTAFAAVAPALAQPTRGPGIEAGLAYNQLLWSFYGPAGPWRSHRMADLYITPAFRLTYLAPLRFGIDLLPFAGYSESGGSREEAMIEAGGRGRGPGIDSYRLRNLETGVLALYRIGPVRVGAGARAERLLDAERTVRISAEEAAGAPEVFRLDVTHGFKRWAASAGLRGEWSQARVVVAAEAWFGLGNREASGWNRVRQNHFRFGLGLRL